MPWLWHTYFPVRVKPLLCLNQMLNSATWKQYLLQLKLWEVMCNTHRHLWIIFMCTKHAKSVTTSPWFSYNKIWHFWNQHFWLSLISFAIVSKNISFWIRKPVIPLRSVVGWFTASGSTFTCWWLPGCTLYKNGKNKNNMVNSDSTAVVIVSNMVLLGPATCIL